MTPVSSGYADVNGIKLYHEIYGQGKPLVLIHGGLTTIGEMHRWVQLLAKTLQLIAVEDAGPRPHCGHGLAHELHHDARRHRRAPGSS